ncbi:hypothetical protein [Haladaptatus sp. NG-SE-30]
MRSDTVVFLSSKSQARRLEDRQPSSIGNVVALEETVVQYCNASSDMDELDVTPYWNLVDTSGLWKECLRDAHELFESVHDTEIDGERVFYETLGYEGTSLCRLDGLRYLSSHSHVLADTLQKIAILDAVRDRIAFDTAELLSPQTAWERAAKEVFAGSSVDLESDESIRQRLDSTLNDRCLQFEQNALGFSIPLAVPYRVVPAMKRGLNYSNADMSYRRFVFDDTPGSALDSPVSFGGLHSSAVEDYRHEILYFLLNSKYLDVVVPLYDAIRSEGRFRQLVLVPREFDGVESLDKRGVRYDFVDNYVTHEIVQTANRRYAEVVDGFRELSDDPNFRRAFTYRGVNLYEILLNLLRQTIFVSSIASIMNALTMKRLLQSSGTEILVAPHISQSEVKSFSHACEEVGVPHVGIYRGFEIFDPELSLFDGTHLLVGGEKTKSAFVEWGVDERRISVTGLPIFDELLDRMNTPQRAPSEDEQWLENEQWPENEDDRPVVTYLTQSQSPRFGIEEKKEEIRTVFETVAEMDDVRLVVKLHPTETETDVYETIAERVRVGAYRIVRNQQSLEDILLASDVAITKNSITGFDTLIAGCQLLTVDFNRKEFHNNPFADAGVARTATTKTEFRNALEEALATAGEQQTPRPQKITEFVREHYDVLDGAATHRMKREVYAAMR